MLSCKRPSTKGSGYPGYSLTSSFLESDHIRKSEIELLLLRKFLRVLKACFVGDLFSVEYDKPLDIPVARWALTGAGTWLVSDILLNEAAVNYVFTDSK